MFTQLLSGIALVSVVFLATPPTEAAGPSAPRAYQQHSVQRRQQPQLKQHRQSRSPNHARHHRPHRSARQHHDHHHHRQQQHPHRRSVGISIGNPYYAQPFYAHGHHLHTHDAYCPVVVPPHVHSHVYRSPVWEVNYYPHHHTRAQALFSIIVTPYQVEVYIDGHFIGTAEDFDHGEKRVPLTPGRHTIRLRHHNRDYTQQIRIKSGNTAIVKAHYARLQ